MKKEKNLLVLTITSLIVLGIFVLDFIVYKNYHMGRTNSNIMMKTTVLVSYIRIILSYVINLIIPIAVLVYLLKKRKGSENILIISNALIIKLICSIISILEIISILITSNGAYSQSLYNVNIYGIIIPIIEVILFAILLWNIIKNNNRRLIHISCIGIMILTAFNFIIEFIASYNQMYAKENTFSILIQLVLSIINIVSYIFLLKILIKNDYKKENINYQRNIKQMNIPKFIILISNIILLIASIFTIKILYIPVMSDLLSYILLICFFAITNQKEFSYIVLILFGIPSIQMFILLNSLHTLITIIILFMTIILIGELPIEEK